VSQELHLLLVEVTLRLLTKQLLPSETLQHFLHVTPMLLLRPAIYQDVVHVAHHKDVSHIPNTLFMRAWKTEGALVTPNGITRNSKLPYRVRIQVLGHFPVEP
jgi:hypothetical protein